MIVIDFTNDRIYNEPGPNLLLFGNREDFLQLLTDLHKLGVKNNEKVEVEALTYTKLLQEDLNLAFSSSASGDILLKKSDERLEVNLKKELWREIHHKILSITYEESFNFIEFDNFSLQEDGNIIISTEVKLKATTAR